ncbi:MAG TPA: thiamine diphosphokinase [Acidimicrobiia bacterium]|nr:thiamine diphosphokinase [Acidimicrobiia bacterium]
MDTILVFAGGDRLEPDLAQELPVADLVMAADSGYDAAVSLGFAVDVLVGDLDSITTQPIPGHVVVERHPVDKDQTDLDLALELAMRDEPSRVVVVGGTGGRLDHELATASLICDERWSEVEMDWVSSRGRAHVIRRRRIVHGDVGATVTLLAVGGAVTGLTTRGLRWELEQATFQPGSTWGVSNVMQTPIADIKVGSGCLLVVFPA